MPMVADLMETCIDDVLRAPVVPTVTAADEAGPSSAYATPSVTGEDRLGLAGEATANQAYHKVNSGGNSFINAVDTQCTYCQ